jgi:virginiamycin B lyase
MPARSLLLLIASALLGSFFPAAAQQPGANFPEDAGKSRVLGICGNCHDLNRLTAGYTPEGWQTVVRMMRNFGARSPTTRSPPSPIT